MAKAIETVIHDLQQKIDVLKAPAQIKDWEFKLVRQTDGLVDPSEGGWQAVTISHTWSSAEGEGWFRKDIKLPESVEGIDLNDSLVEFEFMLPIGAGILLNGVEVYRERSWTDSRAVRLKLEEHFDPKMPLMVEVRCNTSDGLAQFLNASLEISHLAKIIFKLDLVKSQVIFCRFLSGNETGSEKSAVLAKAIEALDLEALSANRWQKFWTSVDSSLNLLAPFEAEAKTYTAHLIAHSHIDMNWLWPQAETVDVCQRDFTAMLKLMEHYPEFHFSQSQTATYQFMETGFPAIFNQIKAQTARGNWDVTASTWVEGDLNMAAGETLVRQLLHGRRYAQAHFGSAPLICWEPDTFGHPATLPQLLKKSGIQYYYFCRAGKDYPLFWWEGLDGSRLLAVQDPKGYGGVVNPTTVVDSVIQFASASSSSHGLLVYGVGDHGGGGTAADIEAARMINSAPFVPSAIPDGTVNFYQKSEVEAASLPVVKDELNTVFEGCYTSHGDIKKLNRSSENLLMSTESALALAVISGGNGHKDLAQAWQTLCFHQFHDILCGCAISVTYREAHERLEQMQKQAHEALDQALETITEKLETTCGYLADTGSKPTRWVAFNPLGWERDSLMSFPIEDVGEKEPVAVADESGNLLPIQVSSHEISFLAEDLPAFWTRVYRPVYDQKPEAKGFVHIDPATQVVDNGILRLHVNPENGEIDLLEDLLEKKDLLSSIHKNDLQAQHSIGYLNRLEIAWEKPHTMSAWVIGEISRKELLPAEVQTRVVENGPVRAIIENSSCISKFDHHSTHHPYSAVAQNRFRDRS